MKRVLILSGVFAFLLQSCSKSPSTLFKLLPSDDTGITFNNAIVEADTFNILTHEYIYNGGGVGVADFNNDGLQDIFFAGNAVPNKLYLNKGKLKFQDISDQANVNVAGRWNSGVAVVDINHDGWMDVYVTATMKKTASNRKNMLFINKGLNDEGIPVFEDQAASYNLQDGGYCETAGFFDYDKDGDLDVYVLINQRLDNIPTNYRNKMVHGESPNNDHLYRNNGDGTFTNVTMEAGVTIEGFGLGLSIADFNKDGWPDVYVSNDYLSNDILYINQKNGTFQNRIAEYIGHQSQFSMGNDAADINNDGLPEIITLDMLPETNMRKKTTIGNKSYQNYINNEKFGYEYQYVRNMLHLNNGLDRGIKFSEIGQLAGVYQTEWSWSPLFVDLDNDGNKDLIVTNGFPKDITDKDFANYRADVGNVAGPEHLIDSIPIVKIQKYVFKNNGDLTFKDVTKEWGFVKQSFSNGAAFADLDNDGDVDYVINNINDEASVYENTFNDPDDTKQIKTNYLRVKLKGEGENLNAVGAKIAIRYGNGKMQYFENSVYRGYLSSVENIAHFGLDGNSIVDSLIVEWPDGKYQLEKNVRANQVLTLSYKPNFVLKTNNEAQPTLFSEVSRKWKFNYKHEEDDKIDFNLQRTLPHKFSQSGPGVAVGDVNGDGMDDFILSNSQGKPHTIFTQNTNGSFSEKKERFSDEVTNQESEGLLLFDADGDRDNDLYIVSGGMENGDTLNYQDHLFLNDGRGKFIFSKNALPPMYSSGSCVRAADFDADGDLDLFVAGRVNPGRYPLSPGSYVLQNEKGKFKDVTSTLAPELSKAGMITDALWTDFDNDGHVDLLLAGEFMSVSFYRNNSGTLKRVSDSGLDNFKGWWNSITAGDYDRDGDIDYVVGNFGRNNGYQVTEQYPLKLFAKDFDGNGSIDPVVSCYIRESMNADTRKLYPVHFWDELNSQSPKFRNKYSRYRQYGKATVDDLLPKEELQGAMILEANDMATSYIENLGNGKFKMLALPILVQVAPITGMVTDDVNADGKLDILMIGNDYGNEVFTGRLDAFTGLVLLGKGDGKFDVVPSEKSGFYVPHDAKALARVVTRGETLFVATQNRDSLKVFTSKVNARKSVWKPSDEDASAVITYANGTRQKIELYYGSGYLSQSSRTLLLSENVKEIEALKWNGKSIKKSFERKALP